MPGVSRGANELEWLNGAGMMMNRFGKAILCLGMLILAMLGAAMVFVLKDRISDNLQKGLTGFAAGVMTAASFWSLLEPALEQEVVVAQEAAQEARPVMVPEPAPPPEAHPARVQKEGLRAVVSRWAGGIRSRPACRLRCRW